MRVTKGKDTMTEALDAKLGIGLKEIEDTLNQIEANKTLTAVTLLVTTRTMGFCAAQIYFKAIAQRNPVFCNIYTFYRVNIAMSEARHYNIRRIQEAPIQIVDETYEIPTCPDFQLVTQTINPYPDQVGRAIKAAGPVTDANEYYVPALVCEQHNRRGWLIPQSERVILSNLRETVTSLADEEMNPDIRQVFYQNNPIPGAIWRVLPDGTHILVNPDEIMPADFTSDMLRDDIDEYKWMHIWMQKKLPKYVRTIRINCEEKGDRSAFVCNHQNRTRIKDRVENQDLRDYYRDLKL
jgi:hypothetical protein